MPGSPVAPPAAHNCPQCGQLRRFALYQKWGQKQAVEITLAVTIPDPLLSQRKNRGHDLERSS